MNSELMFSSGTEHWSTPDSLFDNINDIFDFTVDACADTTNYKVKNYYNKKQDGLSMSWKNNSVWVNPPYGRDMGNWIRKASDECLDVSSNTTVVMLLPARTDTKWMHDYVFENASAIVFLKGRLKFSNSKTSAPFPSMIVIFSSNALQSEVAEKLSTIGFLVKLK